MAFGGSHAPGWPESLTVKENTVALMADEQVRVGAKETWLSLILIQKGFSVLSHTIVQFV